MTKTPRRPSLPEKYRQLMEHDFEHVLKVHKDLGHDQSLAVFTLYTPKGPIVVGTGFGGPREKERVYTMIRLMAVAHEADAISYVSEAWMRKVDKAHGETEAEHHARAAEIAPSQAEDRMEVVICSIAWRDGFGQRQSTMRAREMVRGDDGKLVELRPMAWTEDRDGYAEGPAMELLPVRRPSPEQVAKARAVVDQLAPLLGLEMQEMQRGGNA